MPQTIWHSYPFIAPEKYAGQLKGKIAVVTGTSAGIGRAIVHALAAAGASVACVARREPEIQSLVEEVTSKGGHAVAIPLDITASGAAESLVSQVESALGPIDILVNNAGRTRMGPLHLEPQDLKAWWAVFELNVLAVVALTRAVLPGMLDRKSGHIVTVGSSVATMALPIITAYASSKAAVAKFHESLEVELKDTGVYNFSICPGRVETELGTAQDVFNPDAMEHPIVKGMLQHLSGGERGDPELAADVVVAVVADERYRKLSGKQLAVGDPLEPVVLEAEKEGGGRIEKERLCVVNIKNVE